MLTTDFFNPLIGYTSQIMRGDFSKLKDALDAADISQSELARRIGVTRSAVSQWINGHAVPTLGNLLEIAAVLDVSISEIIGEGVIFAETTTERDVIQALRSLSASEREHLARMARLMAADPPSEE